MIRYHSVLPENTKDSYGEYDTVDFQLTFENRQLVSNSIRIEADLDVYSAGTTKLTAANRIYIDNQIGGHTFFSHITTELQSKGVVENLQEYPRYVRMLAEGSMSPDDVFNSENVCELRTPGKKVTNALLMGIVDDNDKITAGDSRSNDFAIKPIFALNQMSGDLSYNKSGAVRVSVKLARNFSALYGPDMAAGSNYVIKNLRLSFMSTPDSGSKSPIQMRTKLNIKQSVNSAVANISTKVPAVCNSVSCSFQRQSRENTMNFNNVETEVLPNVKELQFLFNDSQSQYITFQIKDQQELLKRYLQSLSDGKSNRLSLLNLRANKGYGIGLDFRDFIDLSNQKFNVQLVSDVQSTDKYIMYMYFHSLLSI